MTQRSQTTPSGERTPWFPPTIKPVRLGVYERDMTAHIRKAGKLSYWNGEFWGGWGQTVATAESNKDSKSSVQGAYWRGLTEQS